MESIKYEIRPHQIESCERALREFEMDADAFIVRALHGPDDPMVWKFSTFEFALKDREQILKIVDWLRAELLRAKRSRNAARVCCRNGC